MKKLYYISTIAVAGLLLASCEPSIIEGPAMADAIATSAVENGFSFKQFALQEDGSYVEAADGNYIQYNTSPATPVQILLVAPDGSETIAATGASGMFSLLPKRGSSNTQEFTVAIMNQDASVSKFTKSANVYVPAELTTEQRYLFSESGVKAWTWSKTQPCWGNAGNTGDGAKFTAGNIDGRWWGVDNADALMNQLSHAPGNVATGAESNDAYMVIDEDGNITSYTADGKVIASSTYKLSGYDETRPSGWELGKFTTKDPAVLFPFSINEGGKNVTEFDLMYLDDNDMTLVYTKGNGAGSWGEITFWLFENKSDFEGMLTAGDGKWGWAYEGGEIWGNAGNSGDGAKFTATNVDGKWWGVTTPEELTGQLGHSNTGAATGEESKDAYMIFKDGTVKTYDGTGKEIRSGEFSATSNNGTRNAGWELGKLNTSSTLFPFSINEGGVVVKEFDIMYADPRNMTLVYTKGNGSGSWAEITFWRFAKK